MHSYSRRIRAGVYFLFKLVKAGPAGLHARRSGHDQRPARPLSAVDAA